MPRALSRSRDPASGSGADNAAIIWSDVASTMVSNNVSLSRKWL